MFAYPGESAPPITKFLVSEFAEAFDAILATVKSPKSVASPVDEIVM